MSFFTDSELDWNSRMFWSSFRIHKHLKLSSPHCDRLSTMNFSSLNWFTSVMRKDLNELWSLKMSWFSMTFRNCHCPCSQLGKFMVGTFNSVLGKLSELFCILKTCWFLLIGESPFLLESELQSLFIFNVILVFSSSSYWYV